jgi:hypothetical protein
LDELEALLSSLVEALGKVLETDQCDFSVEEKEALQRQCARDGVGESAFSRFLKLHGRTGASGMLEHKRRPHRDPLDDGDYFTGTINLYADDQTKNGLILVSTQRKALELTPLNGGFILFKSHYVHCQQTAFSGRDDCVELLKKQRGRHHDRRVPPCQLILGGYRKKGAVTKIRKKAQPKKVYITRLYKNQKRKKF